jgi:hypothetical protein
MVEQRQINVIFGVVVAIWVTDSAHASAARSAR